MKFAPLPRSFYEPSAEEVAPLLLGHWLIRRTPKGICGGPIVETEAYLCNDPACHAASGETERNRSMWGPHGHGYIYFIYGCHFCFNAVCRPAGAPEAVLVRAIEAEFGQEIMLDHRPVAALHALTSGPAKLCAAMNIGGHLDAVDLCSPESPLFIARNRSREFFLQTRGPIVTTTRIGISRAVDLPLRFYLNASPFVSRPQKQKPATLMKSPMTKI